MISAWNLLWIVPLSASVAVLGMCVFMAGDDR